MQENQSTKTLLTESDIDRQIKKVFYRVTADFERESKKLVAFYERESVIHPVLKPLLSKIKRRIASIEGDILTPTEVYLNSSNAERQETTQPEIPFEEQKNNKEMNKEEILKTVAEDVTTMLDSLTPLEEKFVSIVRGNKKKQLENRLTAIQQLVKSIKDPKQKVFISESIKTLKKELFTKPIKETAYRVFNINEAVLTTLKEAGEISSSTKIQDKQYLKDITVECVDDKHAPASIYINFTVDFYPVGDTYSTIQDSLETLDKKFGRLGTTIRNFTIHQKGKAGIYFTGEGIFDASLRTEGVKPGSKAPGKGELVLNTVQNTGEEMPFNSFIIPVNEILEDLDKLIPEWFKKETDPAYQQEWLTVVKANPGIEKELSPQLAKIKAKMDAENAKLSKNKKLVGIEVDELGPELEA